MVNKKFAEYVPLCPFQQVALLKGNHNRIYQLPVEIYTDIQNIATEEEGVVERINRFPRCYRSEGRGSTAIHSHPFNQHQLTLIWKSWLGG